MVRSLYKAIGRSDCPVHPASAPLPCASLYPPPNEHSLKMPFALTTALLDGPALSSLPFWDSHPTLAFRLEPKFGPAKMLSRLVNKTQNRPE